jgi:signal peptidase I
VSESTSIPVFSLTGNPAPPAGSSGETKRNLLAALFSALVPGAGQLFLGQRHKGAVLLLILAAILVGFWPFRLLRFYAGFIVLFCSWIVVYLYAACSAQLAKNPRIVGRPSRWWLLVTLPVTILTLSLLGSGVTRASGFRSFKVPSHSMENTILMGDQIVADMRFFKSRLPNHEDVIIFDRNGTFFMKRVIATVGDTIQGKSGHVLVNGKRIDEPYVQHTRQPVPDWMANFGPTTVPAGKYFVMGDNRDMSLDSRSPEFGLVDKHSVAGQPLYVIRSDREGSSLATNRR